MLLMRLPVLLILILFVSCSATETTGDYAPENPQDLSTIPEPVPHLETPTRAGNRTPYEVNGCTYHLLTTSSGYRETGIASWYGMKFQGKPTSNGETFDVFQLTAAHRTLPIPCFARVTNLENGNSIIVRINDRGPFYEGRLIDLSWAAAAKLGFAEQGLAEVEVSVISFDD